MKCRRCIENANSNSLICKTARWHLPGSRAVDKNKALTLFWMPAAHVRPVLLVLSAFLFRSSSSSPSNLHSEVLAVPPPLLLISCTAGRWRHLVRDVPDKWRSRPLLWSSSEAKSPPLIVPHLRANKRPRSLILLEMDYHPLCILLHPSTVFSRLSLPLSHVSCFSFLFLLQSVSR